MPPPGVVEVFDSLRDRSMRTVWVVVGLAVEALVGERGEEVVFP